MRPKKPNWFTRMWGALIGGALFVGLLGGVYAHDHAQYPAMSQKQLDWLNRQKAADGTSCCSQRDGAEVEEEIRYDEAGVGHYWVRGAVFDVFTQVPDKVVITAPNLFGAPVAWWGFQGGVPFFRCYAPGPKT